MTEIFGIHEQALLLRSQRAEILAANIANADTPGFRARDFDFAAALRQASVAQSELDRGHTVHFPVASTADSELRLQYRIPLQPSLDGNTVDLDVERAAFMENAMRYQASLRFLSGRVRGLLTAIRGE